MVFRLRKAANEDFELLYQIKNDSIRPYVEQIWGWDESVQKDFLRRETPIAEVYLVETEAGDTAGFVQLKENEQEIFVGSLFLTSSNQSKGIGSQILSQLLASGKKVRLEVLKINRRAIRFYEANGMHKAGENELKYVMESGTQTDYMKVKSLMQKDQR